MSVSEPKSSQNTSPSQTESSGPNASNIVKGSIWAVAYTPLAAVIRMLGNITLAWLLLPEDFAYSALVTTILVGYVMLSDLGSVEAVIRSKRGEEPKFYNTVWLFNIGRGLLLCVIGLLAAPYLAGIYSETPESAELLESLLYLAAFGLLAAGFESTSLAIMTRRVQLGIPVMIDLVALVANLAVAIIWSYIDPTPWALISGALAGEATKTVASHFVGRQWRNRFEFDYSAFLEIFHFGKWIFLSTLIGFFAVQGDKLLLGYLLDKESFGVYHVATSISLVAYQVLGSVSGKVLFPLFAHYGREDLGLFRAKILEARAVLMPMIALICVGVIFVAPSFFLLYKVDYHGAARICQFLMLLAWSSMIKECMVRAPTALGFTHVQAMISASIAFFRLSSAMIGYKLGEVEGFIIGMTIGGYIGYCSVYVWARRFRLWLVPMDMVYGAIVTLVLVVNLWVTPLLEADLWRQLLWSFMGGVIVTLVFMQWMRWRFRVQAAEHAETLLNKIVRLPLLPGMLKLLLGPAGPRLLAFLLLVSLVLISPVFWA